MFVFRKIWRALFSLNTRFEIRPFALLPTTSDYHFVLTHLKPMFHCTSPENQRLSDVFIGHRNGIVA